MIRQRHPHLVRTNRVHSPTHAIPTRFFRSSSVRPQSKTLPPAESVLNTENITLPARQVSAVARGTAFEQRALGILQSQMSMELQRVGGRSDGGIDLLGWWWIPTLTRARSRPSDYTVDPVGRERRRIRVLAQCKAERKKLGPIYVREMEGVAFQYQTNHPLVAVLVSESQFTQAALTRALGSRVPFFLLHIPAGGDEVGSAFWNSALSGNDGILGGEVEARWERDPTAVLGSGRVGLWWKGEKLGSWTPDS